MKKKLCLLLAALYAFAVCSCGGKAQSAIPSSGSSFSEKAQLLYERLLTEDLEREIYMENQYHNESSEYTVFFSVSDGIAQAKVLHASKSTLAAAWKAAAEKTQRYLEEQKLSPCWVRADIATEKKPCSDFSSLISASLEGAFPYGLAFSENFNTALLNIELDVNQLISYTDNALYSARIANYCGETSFNEIYTFRCISAFCDQWDNVYDIISSEYGSCREGYGVTSEENAREIIANSLAFLLAQQKEDGSFAYGYYGSSGDPLEGYNSLRHCGVIWNLCCHYNFSENNEIREAAKSAIDYLLQHNVQSYDEDTLFVTDGKKIKLGGNALAVLAMTEYMEAFSDDCYQLEAEQLCNGILWMQMDSGRFYHTMSLEYEDLISNDSSYYDGEAVYALAKFYGFSGKTTYLDRALLSMDYFIDNGYTPQSDQWIAYALNELTKYVAEVKYYDFAMKNINYHLRSIRANRSAAYVRLEQLLQGLETYDRMGQAGVTSSEEIDVKALAEAICRRVWVESCSYAYPETAMFFANPQQCLNAFYTRNDYFRVRIDDVQHASAGFISYCQNFERISALAE